MSEEAAEANDPGGFQIAALARRRRRPAPSEEAIDRAARDAGFGREEVDPPPQKRRRGRRRGPSPLTQQLHAWVTPDMKEALTHEAKYLETTLGMLLVRMFIHYVKSGKMHTLKPDELSSGTGRPDGTAG